MYIYTYICIYTKCFRGTLPYFGRAFLRLNYIDITKLNLYPNLNCYGDNGEKFYKVAAVIQMLITK